MQPGAVAWFTNVGEMYVRNLIFFNLFAERLRPFQGPLGGGPLQEVLRENLNKYPK